MDSITGAASFWEKLVHEAPEYAARTRTPSCTDSTAERLESAAAEQTEESRTRLPGSETAIPGSSMGVRRDKGLGFRKFRV